MRNNIVIIILLFLLAACRNNPNPSGQPNTAVPTRPEENAPDPTTEAAVTVPESGATVEPTTMASAASTATPAPPTTTPLPPKELTVCMASVPESLYLYGNRSLVDTAVQHALYENLYTTLGYDYQPQALLKLPSLADGDAVIRSVNVSEGDTVVNAAGNVVKLLPGTQIVAADGEFVIYEVDDPVQMQQMVVDFTFHPLVWSDGEPVTADDFEFSFQLAADPATPGDKTKIERTARYEARGEQAVRWTGLPGFLDPTYFTNVWPPLPKHQLEDFTAEELLSADAPTYQPLSDGPFMIDSWTPGEQIVLLRNPHYYRLDEGLPAIGRLNFRAVSDAQTWPDLMAAGECDVITRGLIDFGQIPDLLTAADNGELIPYFTHDLVFEHIDFGVNSWEYGDDLVNGRPDWFEFVPVRQAIAQCIDRQRMVDEVLYGQTSVLNAYIPDDHPLYPADTPVWTHDPEAANALLDDFGLEDTNGDGWREWVERDLQRTIVATTTFSITLGTNSESAIRLRLNELAKEDLADCGIQVNLIDYPAETWFDDGPFSPLFGRRFDLATFAWRTAVTPPCGLYLSKNITGPEEKGFGGWGNLNATGWGNEEYDAACQAALDALPGSEEYVSNHQEAVRLFAERLPSIPLFQYVKTAVTAPTVRNFQPDPTEASELWNVYAWDIEDR